MNKTIYLIAVIVITGLIAALTADVWQSHDFIRKHGVAGTLRIGQRYNASRWAEPLPLKKIHTYTATLSPGYEVIIESDQDFVAGQQVFIRHLKLGTKFPTGSNHYLRNVSGSIRPRTELDGAPAKIDSTSAGARALDLAMRTTSAAQSAESVATNPSQTATAFLIGGANDGVCELIWNNSRAGEWALLLLTLFLLQAFAINAWTLPWREFKPIDEHKGFVHPSLESIEPDAPRAPVARIAFKPKSKDCELEAPAKAEADSAVDRTLRLPRK